MEHRLSKRHPSQLVGLLWLAVMFSAAALACGDDDGTETDASTPDGSALDASAADAAEADAAEADAAPEAFPCRSNEDGIGCECSPDTVPEDVTCTADAVGGEAVCCGAAAPADPGCFCTRAVCFELVGSPEDDCDCGLLRFFDPADKTRVEVASCAAGPGQTCCRDMGLENSSCNCADRPCDSTELEVPSCEPAMVASCPDSHEIKLDSCE